MPPMQRFAAAANLEVTHLAFYASRIEAATAADTAAAGNLVK
jgi:hypothetical protein